MNKSNREIVLETYPNAIAVNVKSKKGNYYNIIIDQSIIGKGKTSKNAWTAAYRNITN